MLNDLLTEKDIIHYLMTSDFNEGLTNEESKFLLLKYRNFYRMVYSKNEQMKFSIEELESELLKRNNEILLIKKDIIDSNQRLKIEEERSLTWRERLLGKKIKK